MYDNDFIFWLSDVNETYGILIGMKRNTSNNMLGLMIGHSCPNMPSTLAQIMSEMLIV